MLRGGMGVELCAGLLIVPIIQVQNVSVKANSWQDLAYHLPSPNIFFWITGLL